MAAIADDAVRFLARCLRARWDAPGLAQARAFASDVDLDWSVVIDLAEIENVAPLLYEALRGRGVLPPDAEATLEGVYYRVAASNALLFDGLARLLERFGSAGISVLLLKGAALADTAYDSVAERPMGDVDLLVPRPQASAAARVLLDLGYRLQRDEEWPGFDVRYRNAAMYERDAGGPSPTWIGLHWHLLDIPYYERIPIDGWFARSTATRIEGTTVRLPAAEDHLVYLCGHLALHHGYAGLLRYCDIVALARAAGDDLDWDGVLQRAEDWHLVVPLQRVVARIDELWPAILPLPVGERIAGLSPTRSEGRVHRWAAERPRTPALHLMLSVATMPGLMRKIRFLLEMAVPGPTYMRQRYFAKRPERWPLAYALRPMRGLGQLVRRTGCRRPGQPQ